MVPRILTASTLALLLTAAPRDVHAQEPAGFRDGLRLLDAWMTTTVAQRGQPGLSIGVVVDDRLVWAKGYGYADLEHKVPASPQTLYRIASITKTFTAVAILQLRDAGKLQLDDTWKYSNLGFALLGEVVSAVSGEPWERYVQRHILDPLGMASTRTMPRADESGLAVGYARPVPRERPVSAPTFESVDYALQLLAPIAAKATVRPVAPLPATAASYVGRYRSQNGTTTMLVGMLDGRLSLVAPDAANPYTTRVILEPTSDPRAFVMRSTGTFAYDAFGELLTFDVAPDGQVTGYHTPNLRYSRIAQP